MSQPFTRYLRFAAFSMLLLVLSSLDIRAQQSEQPSGTSAGSAGLLGGLFPEEAVAEPAAAPAGADAGKPLLLKSAPPGTGARDMAAMLPAEKREQAAALFQRAWQAYPKAVEHYGVPANDFAGAAAMYYVGALMAYHNADYPDSLFAPLVKNLRVTLRKNAKFMNMPEAQRAKAFEMMAIYGIIMIASQKEVEKEQDPDKRAQMAAAIKNDGRGALAGLQIDPETTSIPKEK